MNSPKKESFTKVEDHSVTAIIFSLADYFCLFITTEADIRIFS